MVAGTLLRDTPRMAARRKPQPEKPTEGRKPLPAELRYGVKSLKELIAYRERMAKHLAELDAVIERASEIGVKEVRIDGVTKGERADELLRSFIGKVANGVNNAVYQHG